MFDFIRKPLLWQAWDNNYDKEIKKDGGFHLKTIQDLAVYSYLRDCDGLTIAEIGGSDSRLLPSLVQKNTCCNVEKFEGANNGAAEEIHIPGVKNVKAFLGEYSEDLQSGSFDVVFSVSVVEHVPDSDLDSFFDDGLRILKKGGLWLHAVDIYIEDEPSERYLSRYAAMRAWMSNSAVTPIGEVFEGPLAFTCDMASNPDDTMYRWGRIAPKKAKMRQHAQCVSLLIGLRKN
ncbi:methyltransferase domain-containing protein [Hyphococcus sp.]|uniref:methyltransferase domain-containing protein n=1 Tax=Hyphococcus sp. TaxID=2038636 RepID=UPI0035C7726C